MAFGSTNANGHLAAELDAHTEDKGNPHGVTVGQIGAAASNHRHTASDVGAAPSDHTHKGMVTTSEDGVTEVGRYLDFHETVNNGADYNVRVDCGTGAKQVLLALPHKNGTLARVDDIPAAQDLSGMRRKVICRCIYSKAVGVRNTILIPILSIRMRAKLFVFFLSVAGSIHHIT